MGFRELKVWQKAKDMAVYVYKMTDSGMLSLTVLYVSSCVIPHLMRNPVLVFSGFPDQVGE